MNFIQYPLSLRHWKRVYTNLKMNSRTTRRPLCELCQNQQEASPCEHHLECCSLLDSASSPSQNLSITETTPLSGRKYTTPEGKATPQHHKSYSHSKTKSSPGKSHSPSDTQASPSDKSNSPSYKKSSSIKTSDTTSDTNSSSGESYSPSHIKSPARKIVTPSDIQSLPDESNSDTKSPSGKCYSPSNNHASSGKSDIPSVSKLSTHNSNSPSVIKPIPSKSSSPSDTKSHITEKEPQTQEKKGSSGGRTVLITGGAGFLGQHIVSLLQSRADHVNKIKVLDLKPYSNHLGTEERVEVESYTGCITDQALLRRVFAGVHSVYHVAGKISYGTQLDIEGMYNINVQGTQNVIQACLEAGVKHLLFCSTVDVVIGHDDIVNGDETSTAPPEHFLFPGYPEMKYKAECLVLEANGEVGCHGTPLKTISLRANVMYGPGDPYYVTSGLQNAHTHGGVLYQVGDGSAKFQPVYVGNTAWAFLCADQALENGPKKGGQFYFIPDQTPLQNTFHFMRPFLKVRGYQLSGIRIPYTLVYGCLLLAEMVAKVLSPLVTLKLPTESYSVKYINMNLYFSGRKAREELGFTPIFSPDVAIGRSIEYYKNVKLQ